MNQLTGVANAVTLITGPSGAGKTSLLATGAEWLWKRHHKKMRLYTADGGGFGIRVQTLVQLGIIDVFRMRTRCRGLAENMVEETCMRVSQGWWPKEWDRATGDAEAGVEMVPPFKQIYRIMCPKGHLVKESQVRPVGQWQYKCECGAMVTGANATITDESAMTPGFEEVGAIAIEGLTSMGDWIMMALADRTGKGELGGEKPALGGPIRSGNMVFGSNNRAHYGFAQTQAEKWLLNSTGITGLILPPIYTGLETRMDEGVDLAFYGPSIPGQARVGKVPQWVGNYLGAQVVRDDKGNREWRLYTTEYRGEDQVPHRYKARTDPGMLPDYLSDKKDGDGKPFTGFNLGLFFEILEQARESEAKRYKELYPDAPGITQPAPAPAPVAAKPPAPRVPAALGKQ